MRTKGRTRRRFRLPSLPAQGAPNVCRLDLLHHVTHAPAAVRILEDGRIARRLVDDGSILDAHRSMVTWLAPNRWVRGSRHGTVQFSFDFAELVAGRRLYWVEYVEGRAIPTCRLLVTDADVRDLPLRRYDPDRSRGPLRLLDGAWFWRDDVAMEIMFDGDIPLSRCRGLAAVAHNQDYCGRGSAVRCGEVEASTAETAARVLGGFMAGRYGMPAAALVTAGGELAPLVAEGLTGIRVALGVDFGGVAGAVRRKRDVDELVRAALLHLSVGDVAGAVSTVALAASARRVRRALDRLLTRRLAPARRAAVVSAGVS